jgi:hypothetical protein
MEKLVEFIKNLNPILQGAIGSAVFAFILWFLKYIFVLTTNSIKKIRLKRESAELTKYFIHNYMVGSNGLYYYSQGYLFVFYKVFQKIVLALIVILFGTIINSIFPFESIFLIISLGIAIYILIEAYSWFYPKLSKGDLSRYNQDLVKLTRETLLDERLRAREIKREKSKREDEVSKLKTEIEKLQDQLEGFSEKDT